MHANWNFVRRSDRWTLGSVRNVCRPSANTFHLKNKNSNYIRFNVMPKLASWPPYSLNVLLPRAFPSAMEFNSIGTHVQILISK